MQFLPHDYQKFVIRHIVENPGCGIFLDMGLGKTSITLAAVQELMYDRFEVQKVLIVAPKRVAETTWQEEAEKWEDFHGIRFSEVLGQKKNRIIALERDADIYIVNRENIVWLAEYYRYRLPFDMLILDESTSFKDAGTKRWRALKKCRGSFSRVVLLTGTPSPNSLTDLWAPIYLLDGGERLGRTLTEFRNRYFVPDKRNGAIVYSYRIRDKAAEDEIYRRISDICVSLKPQKKSPPAEVIPYPVELGEIAKNLYADIRRDYVQEFNGEEISAASAAAVSNKLQQIANGAVYTDDKNTIVVDNGKIEAVMDIRAAHPGEPVLVFIRYISDGERLKSAFPDARTVEGPETFHEWNAGKIPMLIVHPASAGYGLNLQAGGHIVIWYGLTWSLEQYQQANARLDRQGQTKTVKIFLLTARGTIDERICRALQSKRKGQDAMMEAVRAEIGGSVNDY